MKCFYLLMILSLLSVSGIRAQTEEYSPRQVDSLYNVIENYKEELVVLNQQYDQDIVESRIYNVIVWILGFIVLLLIVALVYQQSFKEYENQIDESERKLLAAKMRIFMLENSEGEHDEEIASLRKKMVSLQQLSNEQLGKGKEMYETINSGGVLKITDDERWLIKYYSVLRYETFNHWEQEYKHLSNRLITFLILKDMGKSEAEIKHILGISDMAFRATKSRLNRSRC